MIVKTRKTFLPLVAVALAMVVVAPSCSKDDDKPKPGVANTGSNSGSDSQNSGSNTSQNSGNSGQTDPQKPGQTDPQKPGQTDPQQPGQTDPQKPGQTDPQKPGTQTPAPMFTPEEAKKFVEETEAGIKGMNHGGTAQDGLAAKIVVDAIDRGDETARQESLERIKEIKGKLARCPEGTPGKAELAGKMETMLGAIDAYERYLAAKKKAEEVGKPDNKVFRAKLTELGKASPDFEEGVKVKLKDVKPDAFVPNGTARKAYTAVQELTAEVDEILKKRMHLNASAADLGDKELVARVKAVHERVAAIREKDMPQARSEEAKNKTAPGSEEWQKLNSAFERLFYHTKKMQGVAEEAEKLKPQFDAANEEDRLLNEQRTERGKVKAMI